MAIRDSLPLLREHSFGRLFAARLGSEFGNSMAPVAIAFGVLEMTGSASSMGIVVSCQIAAQALFQLLGGAWADRGSRRAMMVRADCLAAVTQGTMAFLLVTGRAEIWMLCGLMATNGLAMALHNPAAQGLIPQVVPGDRLQPANALLGVARSGAHALGAACAGILVATVGSGWALAVDAATFGASAALVLGMRPRAQVRGEPTTLLRDLRLGWDEFVAHRWLWVIVLQFSLVVAASEGTMAVVGPTVAKRLLGGATDWGWIVSGFGFGTLAGGFVAMRVHFARPMYAATLLVLTFALPSLLLSGPAPLAVLIAGAFVSGVCGQLFAVLWFTALQVHVAPEALSRVSAYDHLGSIALAPLGVVAAGVLLETIGPRTTLWIAAAAILLPTFTALTVREVRELRSGPGGAAGAA